MASIESAIKDFSHSMTIIVMVVLILAYQVFFVHRVQITKLNTHHISEPYAGGNPYAARLPTIVDSGLTNSKIISWGNHAGGGRECPTADEAKEYLAQSGMDYYSSFLGGHEPPVFYDIGDVQKTRDTRHGSQSGTGVSAGEPGKYTGNLMYEPRQITYTDPSGATHTKTEYVPCRSARYILNAEGKCQLPAGMTEAGTFHDINESFGTKYQTDADFMSRAY